MTEAWPGPAPRSTPESTSVPEPTDAPGLTGPAPGWYHDDNGVIRWWNGAIWDVGAPPPAPPPPYPGPYPTTYASPYPGAYPGQMMAAPVENRSMAMLAHLGALQGHGQEIGGGEEFELQVRRNILIGRRRLGPELVQRLPAFNTQFPANAPCPGTVIVEHPVRQHRFASTVQHRLSGGAGVAIRLRERARPLASREALLDIAICPLIGDVIGQR